MKVSQNRVTTTNMIKTSFYAINNRFTYKNSLKNATNIEKNFLEILFVVLFE